MISRSFKELSHLFEMAEALGVVSSGFAVVSLALQLVDAVQKLQTFWQSFEDGGSNVERIKDHLVTLHAIGAAVAETCQQEPQIGCTESVLKSLLACKARTDKLMHLTRNIGQEKPRGRWNKRWTNLRATLRDKTIRKIENQLNGDVMMLLLALQPFFQ